MGKSVIYLRSDRRPDGCTGPRVPVSILPAFPGSGWVLWDNERGGRFVGNVLRSRAAAEALRDRLAAQDRAQDARDAAVFGSR